MPTALVVDDDRAFAETTANWIASRQFEALTADSVAAAREVIAKRRIDVALIGLKLCDGSGLDLLDFLQEQPSVNIAIVTRYSTAASAVKAFRSGALDYLVKPVDLERLERLLNHARHAAMPPGTVQSLRSGPRPLGPFEELIGASPQMQKVFDLIERVAPTDATVLVTGETGTGKDLVAQSVHALSPRARKTLVAINCGAMAPELVESELFGHEKGSFTSAERRRVGVFERAHLGTLFLDEITETPINVQTKLLRVVESGMVTRVGGEQTIQFDVRVIAATNRDAKQAVAEGRLREDLFYRLSIFPIALPPLRERGDDIELLAKHFVAQLNKQYGSSTRLTQEVIRHLKSYGWPGNVRELRHTLERAMILAPSDIDPRLIPMPEPPSSETDDKITVGTTIAEMDRRLILTTVYALGGDKRKAAAMLGIGLKTLYNRLNLYKKH